MHKCNVFIVLKLRGIITQYTCQLSQIFSVNYSINFWHQCTDVHAFAPRKHLKKGQDLWVSFGELVTLEKNSNNVICFVLGISSDKNIAIFSQCLMEYRIKTSERKRQM